MAKKWLVRFLILAVLFGSFPVNVMADDTEMAKKSGNHTITIENNTEVLSRFVGYVSGLPVYRRPVAQGSLLLSSNDGPYLKFWWSKGLTQDGGNKFCDERDYIVGFRRNVGILSVDLSYAYYDLYKLMRSMGDLHAFRANIGIPNKYVTPYFALESTFPVNGKKPEGGNAYRIGLIRTFQLLPKLALTIDGSLHGNDGTCGFATDHFSSLRGSAALTYRPTNWLSITPNFNGQLRLGHRTTQNGIAPDLLWGGVLATICHEAISF